MKDADAKGLDVARVHTGDPAIFGAHREQMDALERLGIEYEVIPGVSSFLATAAALRKEYTLPGVSQTVILTRMEGRTPMPPKEKLRDLAKHNATMIIFLSVGMIDKLAETLREEYREDTPVAVVYKASWEDQKIVIGNLTNIAQKVKEAGITKTAPPPWWVTSSGMSMSCPNCMIRHLHMSSGKRKNKRQIFRSAAIDAAVCVRRRKKWVFR